MQDRPSAVAFTHALHCVPSGVYVVTARHEDRRTGLLVHWIQQCCARPPMLTVSMPKGRPILPLISESHRFAVCQLRDDERIISRKFRHDIDPSEDPFLGFELHKTETGLPIFAASLAYFECEVNCHMDVDGDHDLFVGTLIGSRYHGGAPMLKLPSAPSS